MPGCLLPITAWLHGIAPIFPCFLCLISFPATCCPLYLTPYATEKRLTWLVTTPRGQCPRHRACDSLPLLSTLHLTPTTARSPQVQAAVFQLPSSPPWCLVLVLLGSQHHLYAEWTSSASPTPHRCQHSARPVHNSGPFTGPVLLPRTLVSVSTEDIWGSSLCPQLCQPPLSTLV